MMRADTADGHLHGAQVGERIMRIIVIIIAAFLPLGVMNLRRGLILGIWRCKC
jgi:hypothetical protein